MSAFVTQLSDFDIAKLRKDYDRHSAQQMMNFGIGALIFILLFALSFLIADVRLDVFFAKIGGFFGYFSRILTLDNGRFVLSDPVEWFWGWKTWLALLLQTLLISYCATLLGSVFAFIFSFLQARNLGNGFFTASLIKRFLEFCRTVPDIVFALVFVVAFGLGPFPGVLAMMLHTTGALGKQFSEIIDNIDMKPMEGLRATGAGWLSCVRFGVLPQVLTGFITYALLRFEINVRGASVMGFVGAGGIGQDLIEAIRKFYYPDVSAILCMIIVTVFIIDIVSEKIRHNILKFSEAT